jgi:enterochelin esterase family protein
MKPSIIDYISFESRSLKNNPLGDPHIRNIPVYLPPNYDEGQEYPTVYILSGYTSRSQKYLNDSFWDENIQERMDRLILEEDLLPMIVVLPDCVTKFGGAQYLNTVGQGNYEDYLLELVDFIDSQFKTKADRNFRAIAGHSSGGFGTQRFGMYHPDIFGMIADHAGDKYFELSYKPDIPKFLNAFNKIGEDGLLELLEDPKKAIRQGGSFYALMISAMAATYSPNPDSPFGFDLPFNPYTGELHQDIWTQWLSFDPVYDLYDHVEALQSLNLLYMDCGLHDEYNLLYGCRIFAERLDALGIPYQYEEFDGRHSGTVYRFDVSLTAISDTIRKILKQGQNND